jgi:hypothetical protein
MMDGREYLVVIRREGRAAKTVLYQTEKAARAKIDRVLAFETVKSQCPQFEDMPDLVETPTLRTRAVGEWIEHVNRPPAEPSDEAVAAAQSWIEPDYGSTF